MTALFIAALSAPMPYARTIAFWLFSAAALTDFLDGYLARRLGLITDFGKLMDSLADKVLVTCAFVCLVGIGFFPAWAVGVVVAREFLITGLRGIAASRGIVLPAERIGKHKAFWQMASIVILLALGAAAEWPYFWGDGVGPEADAIREAITPWLVALTVGFTGYSGIAYLVRHSDLIQDK